jgi:hypothetical protein
MSFKVKTDAGTIGRRNDKKARGANGTPKGTSIDPGEEYKPTIQLCVDLPMKANSSALMHGSNFVRIGEI